MSALPTASGGTLSVSEGGEPARGGRTPLTRVVSMAMRWAFLPAALALVIAQFVLSAPRASADTVTVDAKVKQSLVEVWATWTGWVQIPAYYERDGQSEWVKAVVQSSCTGFVVDSSGFIATAGHCVDNSSEDIKAMLRKQMVDDGVRNGNLDASAADGFLRKANDQQWLVEGHDRGTPVERQIEVLQPDGVNRVIDHWTTVQVVQFQGMDQGDNALLQVVESKPLVPLVVADNVPTSGEPLTVVGFPADVGGVTDKSRLQQPSFIAGTVSGQQVLTNGVPVTEVNANFIPGMSGGPAVNSDGEVVGVISQGFLTKGNNFITNAPALRRFLLQNGVHLAQPPAPAKPFPWIWVTKPPWIWVIISATVLALLVPTVLVSLVLRRRKKRRSTGHLPPSGNGQPYPPYGGYGSTQQPFGYPAPPAPGYAQSPWYPAPAWASQQSPTGTPQPPRDLQSDVAAAKPEELVSVAPELVTSPPNGEVKTK